MIDLIKSISKNPYGEELKKVQSSSHYQNGIFQNVEPTPMMREGGSYPQMLLDFLKKSPLIKPSRTLPNIKADLHAMHGNQVPEVVWFGHSSYLIAHQGKTILVDPVLVGGASPVSFIGGGFPGTAPYSAEDIPTIDLLVLTHDHYDHLSYKTLEVLKKKIRAIVAPTGVASHLEYWGFDSSIITELDWHESATIFPELTLTSVPARHFSGRFINRNKTAWTAYVLSFGTYTIFLGGDSGYDAQFKTIGEAYGPFDLAFVECGQYGKNWPYIHMFPEQTAQAARDLNTKILFPVHWAKFVLSNHAWNEPMKRLAKAALDLRQPYEIVTPMIGEVYTLSNAVQDKMWWDFE
jgi:L-ascorbate metabolism protein UlaG (beta-lactamase superfamily)